MSRRRGKPPVMPPLDERLPTNDKCRCGTRVRYATNARGDIRGWCGHCQFEFVMTAADFRAARAFLQVNELAPTPQMLTRAVKTLKRVKP